MEICHVNYFRHECLVKVFLVAAMAAVGVGVVVLVVAGVEGGSERSTFGGIVVNHHFIHQRISNYHLRRFSDMQSPCHEMVFLVAPRFSNANESVGREHNNERVTFQ